MISYAFIIAVILLIFAAGYRIGVYREHNRWAKIRPTRMQIFLSTSVHREIRANRMQGMFDGWNLAHRTDSEPLSTK